MSNEYAAEIQFLAAEREERNRADMAELTPADWYGEAVFVVGQDELPKCHTCHAFFKSADPQAPFCSAACVEKAADSARLERLETEALVMEAKTAPQPGLRAVVYKCRGTRNGHVAYGRAIATTGAYATESDLFELGILPATKPNQQVIAVINDARSVLVMNLPHSYAVVELPERV